MPEKQSNRESKRKAESKQFNYKVLKTAALVLLWVTSGLFISLAGATLVDFKQLLHTDFDILGTVMVLRTVGYVIGCSVASVLHDKIGIQSELIVAVAAAVCSSSNFLKPLSPSVIFFGAVNTAEGFAHSCMNTVNNALILDLWGRKASMPLHIFHFGFGLGGFLGPLLTKDYLSIGCPDTASYNSSADWYLGGDNFSGHDYDLLKVTCKNSTEANPMFLRTPNLEVPFSIVGSLLAIISLVLFTFYFLEKCSGQFRLSYTKPAKVGTYQTTEKVPKQSICDFIKSFHFRFVVGLFFVYMLINTFEGVVYNYLFTFAYEGGTGFSKPEAAYLTSAYWGSYTLSRLLASLIAHFVSVKIMIFVEFVGSLGSLLSMLFLGFSSKVGMWVSACLLGIFSAPIWPSGLAWADRYVRVKASVVAVTDVGAGIGGSICMWVAGHLVQLNRTHVYLCVASSGCACAIIIVTLLQIYGYRQGDRHAKRKNSACRANAT
ncbi:sodium-dependent glucose transporter 1A-like [Liolophura sinensis]|uniref:sodium-dependent glucose transporter 1A-like n=1 Tax=Liolophura sinensis TaxID=3198878 RepID=UPI0031584C5D